MIEMEYVFKNHIIRYIQLLILLTKTLAIVLDFDQWRFLRTNFPFFVYVTLLTEIQMITIKVH